MRESACADVIFRRHLTLELTHVPFHFAHQYVDFSKTSHGMVLLVEFVREKSSKHSRRKNPSPLCACMFYTKYTRKNYGPWVF